MKILFICNRSPFSTDIGNSQRTGVFLKAFRNNGHVVDVSYVGTTLEPLPPKCEGVNVVLWNDGHSWAVKKWEEWKVRLLFKAFKSSFELSDIIQKIVDSNTYDYIFCRYIETAELAGLYRYSNKLLLDIDDLPHKSYQVYIENPGIKGTYYWFKLRRLQMAENKYINTSCTAFLPNNGEASRYGTVYFPNIPIISTDTIVYDSGNHNLLFIGYMAWPANYNGIDSFISNCWESILEKVPSAHLLVAGKGLPQFLEEKFKQYKNVVCLGFVESLVDFYSRGNIFICPIYTGGGTNIKIAEAMTMGKACVVSEHAVRGYEQILVNDVNALISKDDNAFIEGVVKLLNNDAMCKSIAQNAMNTAKHLFSQSKLDEVIRVVL